VTDVRVRRIYDPIEPDDGQRVLVDGLWPRGVAKSTAELDDWCKAVAPSKELRTWFGHDPSRLDEFRRRYRAELAEPGRSAALDELTERARRGRLTLLTATKDLELSHAPLVAEAVMRDVAERS